MIEPVQELRFAISTERMLALIGNAVPARAAYAVKVDRSA
jgi:hypothetical protein